MGHYPLREAFMLFRNQSGLPAGDDLDNFQAVPGLNLPMGEFRGGNGFAVVFHDDASRE